MKINVSIIGGGPTAITLACFLDSDKFNVSIYEKNKALGRKFLVAGDGGFNLTHSETKTKFIDRYTPRHFLKEAFSTFTNVDLQNWLKKLGIPTFTGSSGRVYPEKGIKPIEVLNTLKNELLNKKVTVHYNEEWTGWKKDLLTFKSGKEITSDLIIFCLGGGSWEVTGSNSKWLKYFSQKGIKTIPFQPSNCAYKVSWEESFIKKHQGKPLKNISITNKDKSQKGEVVITKFGIEGNAIYALSPQIRDSLKKGSCRIHIDLKPTLSEEKVYEKMLGSTYQKIGECLKRDLKLSATQTDLIKANSTKEEFIDKKILSRLIKALPLELTATATVNESISTVGGIALEEVDKDFQLKKLKGNYCLGEMMNYDAPTGGYLLQACFSSGAFLAKTLNESYISPLLKQKTY